MKTEKGSAGYVKYQQRVRTIRTVILFAVVFAVFIAGLVIYGGDRRNICSIAAAVLCIPAAMSAVSMIMMWMRKPVSESFAEEVRKLAGDARVLMELYVTTSEHGLYLHAAVIRDGRVIGYAPEARSAAAFHSVSAHIRKALEESCGPVEVTITRNFEEFREQTDELAALQTENPELQDEIAQVLLSLSL